MNRNKNGQKSQKSSSSRVNANKDQPPMDNKSVTPQRVVGAASSYVNRQPTYIRRSAAPFSPKFGEGIKVTGKQYMTSAVTTATDSQLFSGNSPQDINTVRLSPDALNGRLALEARTFQRYRFTKVRIIYTPRVGTGQAGEFCLAYYADGAAKDYFTPTFTSIQDSDKAVISSFHNGGQQLIWNINVPMGAYDSYFCEMDTTGVPGLRQSIQGQLIGFPDVTSIGAVTQGNFAIEYEVLFYCPTSDLGFTVTRIRDQEEAEYLSQCQKEYRLRNQKKVESSSSSSTALPPPEVRSGRWITL